MLIYIYIEPSPNLQNKVNMIMVEKLFDICPYSTC